MKLPPYEVPETDRDLTNTGVSIDPDDHERFPFPPHRHGTRSPYPDCPACGAAVAALAERRRLANEAAAERSALKARLDRERDEFFARQRAEYAALEERRALRDRRLRNRPMPPFIPPPHPLAPLPCQVCGRFPAQHTLMANGALVCWSPENEPADAAENDKSAADEKPLR